MNSNSLRSFSTLFIEGVLSTLNLIVIIINILWPDLESFASEHRLKIEFDEDQTKIEPPSIEWDKSKDTREPIIQIRSENNQPLPLYYVTLHGKFLKKYAKLLYDIRKIPVLENGDFSIEIQVKSDNQEVTLFIVDFNGKIQKNIIHLSFTDWNLFLAAQNSVATRDSITSTLQYQFTDFTGTDTYTNLRADLYAKANWRFDLGWEHDFEHSSWRSILSGGVTLYSFEQPLSVASLSTPNKTTWQLQVEARDQISSEVTLLLNASYSKELGISGLNTSTLSFDGVMIPKIGVGLHIHVLKVGALSLDLIPSGKLLLPGISANYSSNFGNEEAIVLSLKKEYQTTLWELTLGASRQGYTTSFSDNSQNNLFLSSTFGFDLHRRTTP